MSRDAADLRLDIERLVASGDAASARILLEELWRQNPSPALAAFVVSRFDRLRSHLPVVPCRLAILRSFTVEPVVPLLRAAAAVNGIDVTSHVGDFNAYAQEILDEHSSLYRFAPDVVVLAVQTRDIAPDIWDGFADLSSDDIQAAIQRVTTGFSAWVKAFRARSQAHLVVHTLETPLFPNTSISDAQSEAGQIDAVRSINRALGRLAREHAGVYLLDYDGLVARHGRLAWRDERKWLTARLPIASSCLIHLVNEWVKFLHPLTGKVCKALVADLDNTLWGGVVGEDGANGIALGAEYPGAAYRALQRAILDLHRRGIVLAVCSKNNRADALEVLGGHREMLLRPEHFTVLRINWKDKIENLREIAAELNLGLDALAFLDDSPAERERVRRGLPEVAVIDLPADPMGYARAVQESPVFQRLGLSAEDRERSRYYANDRLRAEIQQKVDSLDSFYESLSMEAEISLVTPDTLPRVAQLTQKTNQFNLTGRRYSEQQIADLAADPSWRVYALRFRDRFGDNGVVGVSIAHDRDGVREIDTFLLSCRVIGRTVETALLATVAEHARLAGSRRLIGWFLRTAKNSPAKGFYASHGFACTKEHGAVSCWELDLTQSTIAPPPSIKRHVVLTERAE